MHHNILWLMPLSPSASGALHVEALRPTARSDPTPMVRDREGATIAHFFWSSIQTPIFVPQVHQEMVQGFPIQMIQAASLSHAPSMLLAPTVPSVAWPLSHQVAPPMQGPKSKGPVCQVRNSCFSRCNVNKSISF